MINSFCGRGLMVIDSDGVNPVTINYFVITIDFNNTIPGLDENKFNGILEEG